MKLSALPFVWRRQLHCAYEGFPTRGFPQREFKCFVGLAGSNCWNIDLLADLAEVIPITVYIVWQICQRCILMPIPTQCKKPTIVVRYCSESSRHRYRKMKMMTKIYMAYLRNSEKYKNKTELISLVAYSRIQQMYTQA